MNRAAFVIAALLTAFVLVVTGGLAASLAFAQSAAAEPAAGSAAAQQRDSEWRQLLAQANERLRQAYRDQTQADPARTDDIGALGAARAALRAAPEARLLRPPERVVFEGVVAYEVVLDQGPVYVDAATGQVVYDGTGTAQFAPGDGEHDDDEWEEHEEHDVHEREGDHGEHGDDDD